MTKVVFGGTGAEATSGRATGLGFRKDGLGHGFYNGLLTSLLEWFSELYRWLFMDFAMCLLVSLFFFHKKQDCNMVLGPSKQSLGLDRRTTIFWTCPDRWLWVLQVTNYY